MGGKINSLLKMDSFLKRTIRSKIDKTPRDSYTRFNNMIIVVVVVLAGLCAALSTKDSLVF